MSRSAVTVGTSILLSALLAVSLSACGSVGAGGSGPQDAPPTPLATAGALETPVIPPEPTMPPDTGKPDLGSMSGGLPPSAVEIEAWIREDTAEFPQLDRVIQKTVSLNEVSVFTKTSIPNGYHDTDTVILATGVGVFVPQFRHDDETYLWGATMIDPENGGVIGTFSGRGDPPALVLP